MAHGAFLPISAISADGKESTLKSDKELFTTMDGTLKFVNLMEMPTSKSLKLSFLIVSSTLLLTTELLHALIPSPAEF